MKAIDILVMKKLSEVVNVVPVIAKSDSLTLEEREAFKERVRLILSLSLTLRLLVVSTYQTPKSKEGSADGSQE